MPDDGSLTLGDVAAKADALAIACSHCGTARQYILATLIEKHSSAYTVPMLLHELSRDCHKRKFVRHYDQCGVHCPELSGLFLVQRLAEF
jgi:hypothetical protein